MLKTLLSTISATGLKKWKAMPYINVPKILQEKNRIEAEEIFSSKSKSAYLGENRVLCIVLGKYKMYVDSKDVGFAPHMMFDGYWEYWLTKFIADNVSNGDHVLDVGANAGYYTLLLSDLVGAEGKLYGFEPNPAIFELLTSTVQLNGFNRQAALFNAALADVAEPTPMTFYVPKNEPKNGTLVADGYVNAQGQVTTVQAINISSLDLKRLDFVKIDVEGAELSVLTSLLPLKKSFAPKIVVEVNFGRNYGYDDIVALVGYQGALLHIDFHGAVEPLTREMARDLRQGEDWLVYWPGKDQ